MAAPRRIQNAVLGAAIAAEVIVLAGHPLFGWGRNAHRGAPVTPPTLAVAPAGAPSARSVLLGLSATAAQAARHTTAGRGRYAYTELAVWRLADQRVPGRRPSRPLTRVVSTWLTAGGRGERITVQPARTRTAAPPTTRATIPGGAPLPALSGGPAALDHRLGLGRGTSTQTALQTFAALSAREPIPPATEAVLLRLLAGDAGLANAGTTRDRAGRPGIAIDYSAPSPALGVTVRDTLVLSPTTGALLEYDETLDGPSHHLGVPEGSLLSYTVYLRSGTVDSPGRVPSSR